MYTHLKAVCRDRVPEGIWKELRSLYYAHTTRNVRLGREELPALLAECRRRDIPVIPFKGPALGALVYPHLSLRSFTDLDLLVPEDTVDRVDDLLTGRGYQRTADYHFECGYSATIGGIPFEVDVHWELADSVHPLRIDHEALWRRARPVSMEGVSTRTFAPEDLIVVLSIHGSKHGWARLKWLCDVQQTLQTYEDITWPRVFTRARSMGAERMVLLGLALAKRLLGTALPDSVDRRLGEVPAMKALEAPVVENLFAESPKMFTPHWEKRIKQDDTFPTQEFLFFRRLKDETRIYADPLGVALQLVTPTEHDRAFVPLPDALSFLYYLVRPLRLLSKHLRHWRSLLKSLVHRAS